MILRAKYIVTMDGPPIKDGAVVTEGNRVVAVGPWKKIRAAYEGVELNLGKQILLPGLINAHCHLDYSMMRWAILRQRSFTEWVRRINALKRCLDSDDYLDAIKRGFAALRKWGTTSVVNIESFPDLLMQLPAPPIRTWWFYEMIDIRHRHATEEVVAGALAFFEQREGWLGGFGLSPHAPYTASGKLFELCGQCAEDTGMLITTHVAESREEWKMFRESRGELYEFMLHVGRWMYDCEAGRTPLGHLAAHTTLNGRWLLAHMNELDEDDFALLEALPPERLPSVVHCPGSHRYFGHTPFPLHRLREIGINLCLGTDSLASTDSLSLFDEMRGLQKIHPELSPCEILAMATVNGARALGMADQLGKIVGGASADLIALPCPPKVSDVHAAILQHEEPIAWMMCDGQILPP